MFDTILSIQPRVVGTNSEKSTDEIVIEISNNFQIELPQLL